MLKKINAFLRDNIDTILFFSTILVLVIFISSLVSCNVKKEEPCNYNTVVQVDTIGALPFSEENLAFKLDGLDVRYPEVVMAQAKLETGNYRSKLFVKNNNLFGFRSKKGYLKYKSWEDSVEDYKRWQTKHYRGGDYFCFLERVGYAEDSNYVKRVKGCLK